MNDETIEEFTQGDEHAEVNNETVVVLDGNTEIAEAGVPTAATAANVEVAAVANEPAPEHLDESQVDILRKRRQGRSAGWRTVGCAML